MVATPEVGKYYTRDAAFYHCSLFFSQRFRLKYEHYSFKNGIIEISAGYYIGTNAE